MIFKLFAKPWMRIPLIIIGVLCLFAAIWFGFQMIPLALFQTVWFRATIIGLLLFAIFLTQFLKWRKRRRAAREMEEELVKEPEGDGKVLAEKMNAALTRLKKSGGNTYLYDLPWYIIIGPPGAGKTTALKNSGIEFPVTGEEDEPMEGFGGTRYCDWWFSEDAILIDTAGRYTTQDSDAAADSASWTSFLELLKRSRPNQPINGVMLAFSAEDMMTASDEELANHAQIVRDRLGELHETLRVDFPVYVLFTKADLINGFREYFASFSLNRRKAVWGVTFQTKDRTRQTHEDVGAEFDKLVSRLSDELIDRLSEEPDGISRVAIFGLPGQMALMRDNVSEFLRRVFAPSKHKTNAILRGFYFTSGTQEGTPIDQVLGAMSTNDAAPMGGFGASFMSGQGKSFFIHDLLKKVIFEERDWVSHDARAVRRQAILRSLGFGAISVATVALLAVFGWSFWQNYSLVQDAAEETAAYNRAALDEIARTEIDDPAVEPVLPYLDQMRLMPAGYGVETEKSFWSGLGLGQQDRLKVAASSSYGDALEQMFRPRLILDIENKLPAIRAAGEPAQIYRALKVYMLLGGQAPVTDDDAIRSYFETQWAEEFGNTIDTTQFDALMGHLDAMLELDDTREVKVEIDQAAVTSARGAIVQMSLADQAYAIIQDRASNAGLIDFNLVQATGDAANRVFTTADGTDLINVGVPGLYTYEGYWSFFFDQLLDVQEALERDRWVLGDQADLVNFDSQMRGLEQALQAKYGADFLDAWNGMLGNIKLANMSADKPSYDTLAEAAAPFASPILKLTEAVVGETRLTLEIERVAAAAAEAEAAGGGGATGIAAGLGGIFLDSARHRSDRTGRFLLDSARNNKNQNRVNGTADGPLRPVQRIEEQFRDWHVMLEGNEGQRPIDVILSDLQAIRDNLRLAASSPGQSAALLPQLLSNLTRNNSRLPAALREIVSDAEQDFRNEASDATLAEMNTELTNRVTAVCRAEITSAFPFTATPRHLPPATFGQFFGPGGAMDQYFNTYLAPHVTRTATGLEVRPDSPLADRISPATLRQFDRAEKIRRAFFAAGGTQPLVQISVRHINNHPSITQGQLVINGNVMISRPGEPAKTFEWPGGGSEATIAIFVDGQNAGGVGIQKGPWSVVDLFKLATSRSNNGGQERMVFSIGGRTIGYEFGFSASENPFTMSELAEFRCPQSLD